MNNKTTWIFLIAGFLICNINTLYAQVLRKVLLEEYTTASCGNCPMASKRVNAWQAEHASNSIIMTIHEGSGRDAMSTSTTTAIFNAFHPDGFWFAPAIMIDRTVWPDAGNEVYLVANQFNGSTDPDLDTIALRQINTPAKVSVEIKGNYDAATRLLNATVTAVFKDTVPLGNWRINLFLVEDNVVGYPGLGAFAGWDQHCYDPTWANANYPGMFDGTSIIGYPHRHVMRNAMLGNWGANVIPGIPAVGTKYATTTSLKVDTAYHDDNLSLVAFISSYGANKDQKYVLNANDIKVSALFTTETSDQKQISESALESIYPNPTSRDAQLLFQLQKSTEVQFLIADAYGKIIKQVPAEKYSSGQHQILLQTSAFANGLYYVKMQTSNSHSVKKLMVVGK